MYHASFTVFEYWYYLPYIKQLLVLSFFPFFVIILPHFIALISHEIAILKIHYVLLLCWDLELPSQIFFSPLIWNVPSGR